MALALHFQPEHQAAVEGGKDTACVLPNSATQGCNVRSPNPWEFEANILQVERM